MVFLSVYCMFYPTIQHCQHWLYLEVIFECQDYFSKVMKLTQHFVYTTTGHNKCKHKEDLEIGLLMLV